VPDVLTQACAGTDLIIIEGMGRWGGWQRMGKEVAGGCSLVSWSTRCHSYSKESSSKYGGVHQSG